MAKGKKTGGRDFKKGQSGNPYGRPKREWTWAGLLEEVGEQIEPKTKTKFKELVSRKVWIKAVNGDMLAIKELFNRMDGMPKQGVEHSGSIELPQPIYGSKSTKE